MCIVADMVHELLAESLGRPIVYMLADCPLCTRQPGQQKEHELNHGTLPCASARVSPGTQLLVEKLCPQYRRYGRLPKAATDRTSFCVHRKDGPQNHCR